MADGREPFMNEEPSSIAGHSNAERGDVGTETRSIWRRVPVPDAAIELLQALAIMLCTVAVLFTEIRSIPVLGLFPYLVATVVAFVAMGRFGYGQLGCTCIILYPLSVLHFVFRENDYFCALMVAGCVIASLIAFALVGDVVIRSVRRFF